MLFVGGAASWSAFRSAESFRWVDHTHEVLYHLEASLTDMLNMQTATRGYLLTNKENFLAPYEAGSARIGDTLRKLRELTKNNPAQQRNLSRLEKTMDRLVSIMQERIWLSREGNSLAAREASALENGNAAIAEVRRVVDEMEAAERRLLADRSAAAQTGQQRAVLVFGLGTLFAVAMVTVAGILVRRDFVRRREAEDALRQNRQLRAIFESLPGLCLVLTPDLRIVAVTNAYLKATMTEREKIRDRHLFEVFPDNPANPADDGVRNLRASLERVLQNVAPDVMAIQKYDVRRNDGTFEERFWSPINSPVPGPDGRIEYIIHRVEDVTDFVRRKNPGTSPEQDLRLRLGQMEAEVYRNAQAVQAVNRQLESANKELESFSYSVSHDLRAPLRHVDGFASLLQKHSAARLDDQGRRYLATISDSARQMGRLIDDLLSFSRMGRAPLQLREVGDHDALVAAAIQEGRWARVDRPIEWHIAPLPGVQADRAMLQQVWVNLLDNAVKYSGKVAAPRIEVGARSDPATGEHVFFVRDNGAGFDMRYADKLFGVFQRLHGPTEFEGTGIGLANVRRIILRHGGRTWAEGAPGRGATFYFSLPATSTPAAA